MISIQLHPAILLSSIFFTTISCVETINDDTFRYARDIEFPAKEKRQAIFEYLLKKADIDIDEAAIPGLVEYLTRETEGLCIWSLKHIIVELEFRARGYENKRISVDELKEIIDQRIKAYKNR